VFRDRAFVYAVCGSAGHIRTLHRSLDYLRPRTTLPILVVTDTRRNEIVIDHPTVIDVETPVRLNHHQASIFLKTGLHKFLPQNREYAYLDTDVIAAADGVGLIFDRRAGSVTFASDFTFLESCAGMFSPFAVNCSCLEERKASCSHLTQAIQRKFGVSVPDQWVHWNGGVFLFGPGAVTFMDLWHTLTLRIFEDPYWRIRDQGTLIATVWKLGLQQQARLPPEYNFIVDRRNQDLRFDRTAGYTLNDSLPRIHPTLLHLVQAGIDRPGWSLARDVEDMLEERSRHLGVRPVDPGPVLPVIADRLARRSSPRKSADFKPALVNQPLVNRSPVDYRVIVGRPRWWLSGESVLSETLVRGLRQRGVDARVLLTEEDTDRASGDGPLLPLPAGLPFDLLPAARDASWGSRWGTLVRYLEERAPCIYVPAADWRNSNVTPHLSSQVGIVGIVQNGDPFHYDQVERLGRYWNAIVAPTGEIAARVAELHPELASRIVRIPHGTEVPGGPFREPAPAGGDPLRIVYHGRFTHRQKRIFELPPIVEALLDRGVPVELTIIGDGPDKDELMAASQPLMEIGAIRFLGLLPHQQVLEQLHRYDVCLLTSSLEGLPQAVIEAMASGCVPVLSDTASLSELVRDDINGYRVPVGDLKGFCRQLEELYREPVRRGQLSRAARQTVIERGFRSEDMVDAYLALFGKIAAESASGTFHRPQGLLRTPPYQAAGREVFPVRYFRGIEKVGVFPSYRADYEDYRQAVGEPRTGRLPAWREDIVNPYPVIIASTEPSRTKVDFAAALAQGLQGSDRPAQILLPPGVSPDSMECGEPVRVLATPIEKALWRPRHRALADYLESQAPCLYLTADERLHRSVCPALSNRVGVIGRVDDIDPRNLARAAKWAIHWDAVVAGSMGIAERLIRLKPSLAPRVVTIPLPFEIPKHPPERPFTWDTPLRLAWLKSAGPIHPAFLERVVAAMLERNVPVEFTAVEDGSESVIFDSADVFLVLSESERDRMRLLEAMGRGCVPVVARGDGTLAELVKDRDSGYVLPDGDAQGFAARLCALQSNPVLLRSVSLRAFASSSAFETVEVFTASYSMLFERVLRDIDLGIHCRPASR